MDHKIDIIEQHPLGLPVALDVRGPQSRCLQTQLHFVRNGLDLPRIGPAAHHEIVGKRSRPFFQLQYGNFFCLFSRQARMASETCNFESFFIMIMRN